MTKDWAHEVGHSPVCQILSQIVVRAVITSSPSAPPDMRDDSAEILFQSFLEETIANSTCKGRDVHALILSIQHFFSKVLSTLQGVLKDGFVVAVLACDMPELCKFPSPDSRQKRFLWTYKEVASGR